jgi:hypothetical protein
MTVADTFIDSPGLESANVEPPKSVEAELDDSPVELSVEETPPDETTPAESILETENGEPEATPEADAALEPEVKPKVQKGVQKRIDELTRDRYEAQRDRDYWRQKALQDAARQQAPQGAPTAQPNTTQFGPPPTLAQFGYDENQFNTALAEYNSRLFSQTVPAMVQQAMREQTHRAEAERQQREVEARITQFQTREASVAEKYADYEAVAHNPDLPISQLTADAIQSSPVGPEIAYYLGSNSAEAQRIYGLSPLEQALSIGRIEASFTRAASKKNTNAPPPVSPVGSQKVVNKTPEKMSTEEYRAWRTKQK